MQSFGRGSFGDPGDELSKNNNICKCCNGSGVQPRRDGIKIRCPACNGSGNWDKPNELYKITWGSPRHSPVRPSGRSGGGRWV